jgi:hypothetical protein
MTMLENGLQIGELDAVTGVKERPPVTDPRTAGLAVQLGKGVLGVIRVSAVGPDHD